MQCQNTKQKVNDFKQNFETFYIVLWYNDINKQTEIRIMIIYDMKTEDLIIQSELMKMKNRRFSW